MGPASVYRGTCCPWFRSAVSFASASDLGGMDDGPTSIGTTPRHESLVSRLALPFSLPPISQWDTTGSRSRFWFLAAELGDVLPGCGGVLLAQNANLRNVTFRSHTVPNRENLKGMDVLRSAFIMRIICYCLWGFRICGSFMVLIEVVLMIMVAGFQGVCCCCCCCCCCPVRRFSSYEVSYHYCAAAVIPLYSST